MISETSYLEMDEQAERPVEYVFGEAVTRHGRSPDHCDIAAQLLTLFINAGHDAVGSLLRLYVAATGEYFYPDIAVIDDNAEWHQTPLDTLLTPLVLVEITSPETEQHDRENKLTAYLEIPSLQNYLIVSQDRALVHHYARSGTNEWMFHDYFWRRETIFLESLQLSVPLENIYRDIEVPEGPSLSPVAEA